jgi:hypothetical protein
VDVPRYFPETGHNVDGDFHTHFWRNGAVDTFGYPLTEEFWLPGETEDGAGRMVQYFQRARLEYDLDAREVRRSPLGALLDKAQPAVPPEPGVRYFPETGHNVGSAFLTFFEAAGGVDALGLPISEEVEEHGRPVQWFERVRLEWWPENRPGRQVQFGLIGEEHLQLEEVREGVAEHALVRAEPMPALREWILPQAPPPPRIAWAPMDVPILYYHQVPSQAQLRDQIRAFREAGRQFVPLGQIVAALRGEARLPEKPLALTFDDGWVSQFQNGAPVLQAEGVPATFFVITRYLNEAGGQGGIPGYMTWDQVRTLKEPTRARRLPKSGNRWPCLNGAWAVRCASSPTPTGAGMPPPRRWRRVCTALRWQPAAGPSSPSSTCTRCAASRRSRTTSPKTC